MRREGTKSRLEENDDKRGSDEKSSGKAPEPGAADAEEDPTVEEVYFWIIDCRSSSSIRERERERAAALSQTGISATLSARGRQRAAGGFEAAPPDHCCCSSSSSSSSLGGGMEEREIHRSRPLALTPPTGPVPAHTAAKHRRVLARDSAP